MDKELQEKLEKIATDLTGVAETIRTIKDPTNFKTLARTLDIYAETLRVLDPTN